MILCGKKNNFYINSIIIKKANIVYLEVNTFCKLKSVCIFIGLLTVNYIEN